MALYLVDPRDSWRVVLLGLTMVYGMVARKDTNLVSESVVMKDAVQVDKTAKRMGLKTVAPMDV